jgi:hypothetical protein
MTTYRKLFFGFRIRKETEHSNGFGIIKSSYWTLEKPETHYLSFDKPVLEIRYRRLIEFCIIKLKKMHAQVGFEIGGGRSEYPTIRLSLWRYEIELTIMDLFNE